MKIPLHIKVYGDQKYRNKKCPKEDNELITFVNRIRTKYPDTYGRLLVHPENEQKLINGQFQVISKSRAKGMSKGAPDIIIPCFPMPFLCEMKRRDMTLSDISDEQIEYLTIANTINCFACVALGADAATEAFNDWLIICKKHLTS